MKLEMFAEYPEYQAVTSEVPIFSSEYAVLQNTSHQEIPPYSIEILVSPSFFSKETTLRVHESIYNQLLGSLEYPVCKIYLQFLVDSIEVLELPYISV